MDADQHDTVKQSMLAYMQTMFAEMEEDMAMSHQEKYALLEDAFENASDVDELRVAFEQWYADHAQEIDFEDGVDELWEQAMNQMEE